MVLFFYNDNENIIVKFAIDQNHLSKRNLITVICLDGIYYGFYHQNPQYIEEEKEEDCDKNYLYTGNKIEIPEEFRDQFNLVQCFQSLQSTQIKLTKYFFPSQDLKRKVQAYFNNSIDLKFMVNCVFHKDKNPSLSINLEHNCYYCFSCKNHGSLAKLVARLKI